MLKTLPMIISALLACSIAAGASPKVLNPGFEADSNSDGLPDNWSLSVGGGAKAKIALDTSTAHSGSRSIRIPNDSPARPYVWGSIVSDSIQVKPKTTYLVKVWAKGKDAGMCYIGIAFNVGGEHRMYLPNGTSDWRQYSSTFSTPDKCTSLTVRVSSDDVTKALWADDVSLEVAPIQLVDLPERRYPKDFAGVFPRTKGPLAEHLTVCDIATLPADMQTVLLALQGIVNRKSPRIFLIGAIDQPGADEVYLRYMQEKGYTGKERTISDPMALVKAFRDEITGAIICDPELPGSVHAATALVGIKNALPVSPELAAKLGLPIVMDLRGKWKRNVDAYRFIYDHYWDKMCHHAIAWRHPTDSPRMSLDYIVEFNVPSLWVSKYGDPMKGADPAAEEEFANEILANTPANIPVFGWPMTGDGQGLTEYQMVRTCSEFGKFVPGTEFCTNLSVHTAIRPPDSAFVRKNPVRPDEVKLEHDKVYITLSILESGDALWYWALHQRRIWADGARGRVPINWSMNVSLYDALPDVAQWYYENATPNDTFLAAVSGLGYMNTPVYASRFRKQDYDRIWREYVGLTDYYCRKLGIHGVELFTDGIAPEKLTPFLRYFTDGMKNLDFVINDFTRFPAINTKNADYMVGNTAVFHTLTAYHIWQTADEPGKRTQAGEVQWVLDDILANTPDTHPAFMSGMVISWNFYPSWIADLAGRLPARYQVVTVPEMARLYRESRRNR